VVQNEDGNIAYLKALKLAREIASKVGPNSNNKPSQTILGLNKTVGGHIKVAISTWNYT